MIYTQNDAGHPRVPIQLQTGTRTSLCVAETTDLVQLARDARSDYSDLFWATARGIDKRRSRRLIALSAPEGMRLRAQADLASALRACPLRFGSRSRAAMHSCASLFFELAVGHREPLLLGSNVAVSLAVGNGHLAIQSLVADDAVTRHDMVGVTLRGRRSSTFSAVAGPGADLSQRLMTLARALSDAMWAISQRAGTLSTRRMALRGVNAALCALDPDRFDLPANSADERQFLLNQLDAEILLYDLLLTEFGRSGGRID